ncbi:hypothetical protein PSNIH2_13355 [Pantoea sp. PSNIH2]|nr:hypothetical protein PSNIH2_13355 [Pantoea sp. PSNIH2]
MSVKRIIAPKAGVIDSMTLNNAMPEGAHLMNTNQEMAFIDAEIKRIRLNEILAALIDDIAGVLRVIQELPESNRVFYDFQFHISLS